MKTKTFILIGIILMFIPLIFAIEDFGVFKIKNSIDLIQTCSNCTFNNITSVVYPNSTVLVSDAVMTKSGTMYTYTINAGDVNAPGRYVVNGVGDLDGTNTVWSYTFEVTPTGYVFSSILDNPIFLFLLLIGIVLVVFGYITQTTWLGFLGGIVFAISGIYTMIYGLGDITDLYTRTIGIVMMGVGMVFVILSAYEGFKE